MARHEDRTVFTCDATVTNRKQDAAFRMCPAMIPHEMDVSSEVLTQATLLATINQVQTSWFCCRIGPDADNIDSSCRFNVVFCKREPTGQRLLAGFRALLLAMAFIFMTGHGQQESTTPSLTSGACLP